MPHAPGAGGGTLCNIMQRHHYSQPELQCLDIATERGFALSPSLKDWGDDGTDHGGDAE